MKAEHYATRELELSGWPVRITSYRIGETWYAKADNVSPGANIAKAKATSLEDATDQVVEKASKRLAATRRIPLAN